MKATFRAATIKNTSFSLIHKDANTDSNNTAHKKKDKQKIKDAPHVKGGITPVLEK